MSEIRRVEFTLYVLSFCSVSSVNKHRYEADLTLLVSSHTRDSRSGCVKKSRERVGEKIINIKQPADDLRCFDWMRVIATSCILTIPINWLCRMWSSTWVSTTWDDCQLWNTKSGNLCHKNTTSSGLKIIIICTCMGNLVWEARESFATKWSYQSRRVTCEYDFNNVQRMKVINFN